MKNQWIEKVSIVSIQLAASALMLNHMGLGKAARAVAWLQNIVTLAGLCPDDAEAEKIYKTGMKFFAEPENDELLKMIKEVFEKQGLEPEDKAKADKEIAELEKMFRATASDTDGLSDKPTKPTKTDNGETIQ